MPAKIESAVIKTLCYSDIFDYPLKEEEIWRWLIGVKNLGQRPISLWLKKSKIKNTIKNLKLIEKKDSYYSLYGRDKIVNLRKERKKYSQKKLEIANRVVNIIKIIPSVKLIGITGALAVDNAKKDDDIDLLIIASKGLLWTTRLLVTLLIEITGMRRHPTDINVNNKICLNMFVDEKYLSIPQKERDLFSAHEVAQMKLLWDRDDTYQKFLAANKWVKKYLPNAIKSIKYKVVSITYKGKDKSLLHGYIAKLSNSIESLLKNLQLWYMKNRRTTEVIEEGIIRFHPQDARMWVMEKYKERVARYKLPS